MKSLQDHVLEPERLHPEIGRPWATHLDPAGGAELVAAVAEDRGLARDVEAVLRDAGLRVLSFTSPAAALAVVTDTFVDLVVAEHPLRELDTLRLCRGARKAPRRWRPGYVVVTHDPGLLAAWERRLYDAVAARPVCRTDLLGAVERALARRRWPSALDGAVC